MTRKTTRRLFHLPLAPVPQRAAPCRPPATQVRVAVEVRLLRIPVDGVREEGVGVEAIAHRRPRVLLLEAQGVRGRLQEELGLNLVRKVRHKIEDVDGPGLPRRKVLVPPRRILVALDLIQATKRGRIGKASVTLQHQQYCLVILE